MPCHNYGRAGDRLRIEEIDEEILDDKSLSEKLAERRAAGQAKVDEDEQGYYRKVAASDVLNYQYQDGEIQHFTINGEEEHVLLLDDGQYFVVEEIMGFVSLNNLSGGTQQNLYIGG